MKIRGVTLIEFIIVMVLLGIVAGMAGILVPQGIFGTEQGEVQDEIDWKARATLERMTRELRSINPSKITTLNSTQLTYTSNEGESVTFTVSGGNLLRSGTILANGVTSFGFTYYTALGVATTTAANVRYIQMAVIFTQGSASSPLFYTTVAIRNP